MNANQKVIAAVCLGGVAALGTLTAIAQGSSGFISEQYFKQTNQSLIGTWECKISQKDDDGNYQVVQDGTTTYDVDGNYQQTVTITVPNAEWKKAGATVAYLSNSAGTYERSGFPKFDTVTYTILSDSIVNISTSKHLNGLGEVKAFRDQLNELIPMDKIMEGLEADNTAVFKITGWKDKDNLVGVATEVTGSKTECKRA